ncbi:uncharacterized protein [Manis javanica]|uniref:uncharacterized protein n=1 Tax=Manis javanica TaxID=9974 RepID=UPI003C6D92CF
MSSRADRAGPTAMRLGPAGEAARGKEGGGTEAWDPQRPRSSGLGWSRRGEPRECGPRSVGSWRGGRGPRARAGTYLPPWETRAGGEPGGRCLCGVVTWSQGRRTTTDGSPRPGALLFRAGMALCVDAFFLFGVFESFGSCYPARVAESCTPGNKGASVDGIAVPSSKMRKCVFECQLSATTQAPWLPFSLPSWMRNASFCNLSWQF